MKKILLSLMLIVTTVTVFGQKSNVSLAKNKALASTPDFPAAIAAIQAAQQNSATKDEAETWYVAGTVYNAISEKEYAKELLKQKFDQDTLGLNLVKAFGCYLKSYNLDQQPNDKGKIKPRFTKDIKNIFHTYYTDGQLIRYGSYLFDKKRYADVVKTFEVYLSIPDLEMFKPDELKKDSTYKMVKYYTAIAAINANDTTTALNLLGQLKNDNYELKNVYELLYQEYAAKKDTANFVAVLKTGASKFPAEPFFLQNLINYFIYSGKNAEALNYLNQAITEEPKVAQYQYVKGNLLEMNKDIDGARAAFEKALELKPDYAEAEASLGRLYYNQAINMLLAANDIKDVNVYNQKVTQATDVFKQALPYFEKAHQMNPKDTDITGTLKKLYYRLQMTKEYQALNNEGNN
ncbi:tetratricopeptide repeat protein [Microbacter margulisiae]|uniref:Tetratricopeptide (TPR) repeat protein n=1 Tax=Microbacter margulisiae TaxID=1350067 RepID=A0A7W5DPP4_9PORP|nr:tetratricopeptide repeat protein [Microbacter margulisiae]MBB3186458.1 tetratricopeptide (TPR) repeat protein [Microbacter margulisiae]